MKHPRLFLLLAFLISGEAMSRPHVSQVVEGLVVNPRHLDTIASWIYALAKSKPTEQFLDDASRALSAYTPEQREGVMDRISLKVPDEGQQADNLRKLKEYFEPPLLDR